MDDGHDATAMQLNDLLARTVRSRMLQTAFQGKDRLTCLWHAIVTWSSHRNLPDTAVEFKLIQFGALVSDPVLEAKFSDKSLLEYIHRHEYFQLFAII